MRPGTRFVAGFLCATLLASGSGCSTSQEEADSQVRALYPGMTMQQVADELGNPDQVIKGEPGSETIWIYRFEGGPGAAATVLLVIVAIALIALLALGGGGGSFGGGGGGGDGPPCQVQIRFSGDGHLLDVSPPQPVPGH